MYNLFEQKNAAELLSRLEKLKPITEAQWGKMKVDQMMAHVAITLETPFGPDRKQNFLGKLFGKMAKKSIFSPKPFKKNSPTDPGFIVKDQRNFETEKARVINNIKRFSTSKPSDIVCKKHPFFGDFTAEDWAYLMHKHVDHHLKQFGV